MSTSYKMASSQIVKYQINKTLFDDRFSDLKSTNIETINQGKRINY